MGSARMSRPAIVLAAILVAVAAPSLQTLAAQSATNVTGSGSGVFPSGATYNGVSLTSLYFGKGMLTPGDGSAAGDFEAVLFGTGSNGQPQNITVEGTTGSGSLDADKGATFSGTGTVDMGDGSPPTTQSFTVRVTAQTDGLGTIKLTLG